MVYSLVYSHVYSHVFSSSFDATDVDTIKGHVKEEKSRFVNVVIAQVLDERIPPFILQIFGTNSKNTACDTVRRWIFTLSELKKYISRYIFLMIFIWLI